MLPAGVHVRVVDRHHERGGCWKYWYSDRTLMPPVRHPCVVNPEALVAQNTTHAGLGSGRTFLERTLLGLLPG